MARQQRLWPTCIAPASPPIACSARSNCRSTCGSNTRCAMSCSRPRRSTTPRPRPASSPTFRTGEIVALVSLPDFDPNNPKEARRSPTASTASPPGVYEMGSTFKALHARDGAGFRQGQPRHALGRAPRTPALRQVRHPRHPLRSAVSINAVGSLHLLLQRRRRARSRSSQGVEAHKAFLRQGGPARRGCAPNCRRAPRRSCRAAGAS